MTTSPTTQLDERYSDPDASATGWDQARARWEEAQIYWLSTVRPDGRPHVTPLIAVWHDGAAYFCTGPGERKARNLTNNANVVLTTGTNELDQGLDLVIEGVAVELGDDARLHRIADAYAQKYGRQWHFDVRDGAFFGGGGRAVVYEVRPVTAFGFTKGGYSQTRWTFGT